MVNKNTRSKRLYSDSNIRKKESLRKTFLQKRKNISLNFSEYSEFIANNLIFLLRTKINIEGLPGQRAFFTGRMMESLANGCCYFYPIPTYNADFPNGLVDNEDFIIYNNSEDLIEKIEYMVIEKA